MKKRFFSSTALTYSSLTAPRMLSFKKLSRLRANWFVVGAAFGVGVSFFLNFVFTMLVVPGYDALMAQIHTPEPAQTAQVTPPALADKPAAAPDVAATATPTGAATEKPAEVAAATPTPAPAAPAAVAAAPAPAPEITYPRTVALEISRGQSLLGLLLANRVAPSDAKNVIKALKAQVNPQKLPVGQKISVTLARHETVGDKAAVRELAMKLPNFDNIALERKGNGVFNVAATKEALFSKGYHAHGKVRTSLLQAAGDAHIPTPVINEVIKAFSYDIDFQREIHPGDTIDILMDRKVARDGRVAGFGQARYAALTLQGKKYEIFRFKNSFGEYTWLDGNGNNVKKSLLRTPINAAHITSGFGMRNHPLLGYTKMHKGVDFGAVTGTPIMSAGDGVVEFKGWKTGYGNFVVIKHNSKYETAYGHISRFGNISVGNRVRQGQIIAYVGMTGAATGPHLHYEVRENEVQVNPVAKQFNMAVGLTGPQLAAFKAAKQGAMKEIATLDKAAVPTKPAAPAKVASR